MKIHSLLAACCVVAALPLGAAVNSWTQIGPAPSAATQNQPFAVDPTNASVMYIGSVDSSSNLSLLKSTDRGATWTPTAFASQGIVIGHIAIAPSNPSVIYLDVTNQQATTPQLFRSTDGGATWALRISGLPSFGSIILSLAVDPNDADVAYLSLFSDVYRTTNGGGSWVNVRPGQTGLQKLLPVATVPGLVYGLTFPTSSASLVKSSNAGANWQAVGAFPTLGNLAIDPASPSILYTAKQATVYRSVDSGATWLAMASQGLPPVSNGSNTTIDYVQVLPASGGALLVHQGSCGFFISYDQGMVFRQANEGLPGQTDNCQQPGVLPSHIATSPAAPATAFSEQTTSQGAAAGLYEYTSDSSLLPPGCSLVAAPTAVGQGGSATLTASCSPAAASYVWSSNTGFASTDSGGTVTLPQTTTYTVQGVNTNGPGNVASVTVYAPSPRLGNLSTRARVQTGADVVIGGFINGGPLPKTVVIRGTGPSLASSGVTDPLLDPQLEVTRNGVRVAINDDWQGASNASAIQATGLAPNHPKEAAVMITLDPNAAYTAIVSGVGATSGVGSVEVFEVDHAESPLINISTRANVLTAGDVMIAGFIIDGNAAKTVVVNVAGPSLTGYFAPTALLADPRLTLVRSSDQAILFTNDDWGSSADAAAIQSSGFAPNHSKEPAIIATLPPGAYTAIVEGVNGGTGKAVVGVFAVP